MSSDNRTLYVLSPETAEPIEEDFNLTLPNLGSADLEQRGVATHR